MDEVEAVLLNLELFRSIDPNFGFSFVNLDPASDLDRFSFDTGKHWRLFTGDAGGIQPVNVWFG